MAKNHYEMLQVFPTATAQEIKDAFRFLLFRYHPDHNKGREEWAVQRTMELVESYHVLSDPFRRSHHDLLRGVKIRDERVKKGFALFKPSEKERQADEAFAAGLAAWKAGEYEQGVRSFGRAVELSPESVSSRFNLAASFLAMEKFNEAMQWFQDCLTRQKDDPEIKALIGKVSALNHRKPAAAKNG